MHLQIKVLLVFLFLSLTGHLAAQDIFLLEKPGTINNKKYYAGDFIKLKPHSKDTIISGVINKINDSSIIINYNNEIYLSDIFIVYRSRWGFTTLKKIFLLTGFTYLGLSTLNGLINNDRPTVPEETLIISGSLIAAGFALIPLATKRHKIDNKKWRVKILRFDD